MIDKIKITGELLKEHFPVPTRKEELQKTLETARAELQEIQAREAEERNRQLVGKCFIYQNCYSCPEGPQDYWWLYVRVIGVDGESLRTWSFQTDKYGKVEIEPSRLCGQLGSSHREISREEFDKAWQITLNALQRL